MRKASPQLTRICKISQVKSRLKVLTLLSLYRAGGELVNRQAHDTIRVCDTVTVCAFIFPAAVSQTDQSHHSPGPFPRPPHPPLVLLTSMFFLSSFCSSWFPEESSSTEINRVVVLLQLPLLGLAWPPGLAPLPRLPPFLAHPPLGVWAAAPPPPRPLVAPHRPGLRKGYLLRAPKAAFAAHREQFLIHFPKASLLLLDLG